MQYRTESMSAGKFYTFWFDGYRRLNRGRSVFPDSRALLKALYLATHDLTEKWTNVIRDWGKVYAELSVMYPGRFS